MLPSKPWLTLEGRKEYLKKISHIVPLLQGEEGEPTLHVHVRRLVHEVHEELGGVDEDLVSAVADGAVPPGAL